MLPLKNFLFEVILKFVSSNLFTKKAGTRLGSIQFLNESEKRPHE